MKKNLFKWVAMLLLSVFSLSHSFAQTKTITGTVTDEKGITLPGASVGTKDSKSVVITDVNGKFSLDVPAATRVLSITFVGMEAQQVVLGKSNNVNVMLKSVSSALSDVVVVGYGTVRKKDATGSVASLKRDELIIDAPTNVLQAMQGKVAGVNVTQNDGAPGAALSIRIRGSNSFLGGTEPLYVIDGVPFNNSSSGSTPSSIGGDEKQTLNALSFINPSDIESIDILKDASATAIYGSRGANGVVLITTRRGRSGKDKVEFNLVVGMSQVSKRIKMLSAQDYASLQNEGFSNANFYYGKNYTPDQFPFPGMDVPNQAGTGTYYKLGPADYANRSKDWQDEIFRTGFYQNYSVNVSGGNDAGNHSISFNFLDQNGTIVHSDYKRFGLNLNLNRNVGRIFKIGTSTSLSHATTNGVKTGTDKSDDANAGVIRSALTFPTTIDSIQNYSDARAANNGSYFITNPSIYAKDVLNRVTGVNIFSANYVEVAILKYLKFRQNIGFNYASNRRDQYYPRTIYEGYAVGGDGLKSNDIWNSLTSESILTFNKQIAKHTVTVLAGATYERTNGEWRKYEATDFNNDILQNEDLGSGATQKDPIGDRYQSTLISFLARANYSYDNRYLVTASIRRDGSSKFGKNNKWSNFPSVAVAWKVINEKFLAGKIKILSDLKLRLSYGQTGNQGIGTYSSWSKLRVYKYPLNGILQTGYADDYEAGPANPDLKWETTDAYNAGIDIGFLANRINLHVDGYVKKTTDLLQLVTTASSSGFPRKLVNSGSVQNKGIEISLDAAVISKANFGWNSSFNVSFNKNKITSLGNEVERQFAPNISTGDAPFIQIVGKPIGTLYGWVEDGFYDNEAEVRSDPRFTNAGDAKIKSMIGEIKYRDLDGDPTALTDKDRTYIGDVNPKYTFGFTNNIRYKNWDASIFINGVQGNDIINMNTRFMAYPGTYKNISQDMYDEMWSPGKDNTNASVPKSYNGLDRETLQFSRRFIENGSFVRLKNVTIGYTVKTKIAGVQSLRLSLGANNIFTITKYRGYDPEINSYGDKPALFGVDLGGYPNSRTYNFTVRCNF